LRRRKRSRDEIDIQRTKFPATREKNWDFRDSVLPSVSLTEDPLFQFLLFPLEFVNSLLQFDQLMQLLIRKLSSISSVNSSTQLYISHKTNIGQGYISDLEKGRRKGTTAALKKIADALKVPLDLIIY